MPKGFGLIELVAAIAVVGILAAIAIPTYLNQVSKSRETEARQNLSLILKAQQAYFSEHSKFAQTWIELAVELPQKSPNYDYSVFNAEAVAGVLINQHNEDLKSYLGAIKLVDNKQGVRFFTIQCVAKKTGVILTEDNLLIKENHLGCGRKIEEIK